MMTTAYVAHLFLMSLYITVLHTIPAPANFTIVSHNFRHILQWSPGINSPPQTVFNVRKRCNGKSTVQLNIRNTTVDVSKLLKDIYTTCTFSVWASLDNTTSSEVRKSITPYEDTIIGPPVISLSGCGDCLNITISLPIEGPRITEQIRLLYTSVSFDISWKRAGQSEVNRISVSSNQHVLQNLQPGNQYCVRVLPQTNANHNTRPSDWQCEYTSKEEPRGALCMDIPAPVHLNLSSQYFVHTLSWEKGPGSPDGVLYTVRIRTRSGEVVVKECVNVTSPLRCNLTEALSDVEEIYYISVFAALGSQKSPESHCEPFKPILNTTFEAPLLTVTVCNRSLCVDLRAPAERLHEVYNSHRFRYKLLAISEDGAEVAQYTEDLGNKTIPDLAPGRSYCVNVSIIGHKTPPRPPVCASIPPSPRTANLSDAVVSVVLCLLMLLLLRFTPRLVTRYFCSKPLPAVLSSVVSVKKVLLFTAAESINTVYEDRDFIQKIKRNGDETDTEEETEETVKYEGILAQYLDAQDSSPIIRPASSSSDLLMIQSPGADPSLTSSTDAPSLIVFEDTTEPTASPQETSPLLSISLFSATHVEDEEESGTDVNLFSVKLGEVASEPHKAEPDQILSIKDELESYPQSLLQTDSQSQTSIPEGDEEDEECSDYLSRN